MLPKIDLPPAPYVVEIEYGFSNKAADIDNPTKLVQDLLQKKYNFNDKEKHYEHLAQYFARFGDLDPEGYDEGMFINARTIDCEIEQND